MEFTDWYKNADILYGIFAYYLKNALIFYMEY